MKNRSKVIIFGTVAAVLTAIGVILRTVGLFVYYDRDVGYFKSDALVPQMFAVVCVVAFVIFAVSGRFASRVKIMPAFTGMASRAGSAFAAVVMLAHAVYLVPYCLSYVEGSVIIPALFLIFSALSAIYFALGCTKKYAATENRSIPGFCVIFYATAGLAKSYFDFTTTMNSPDKLLLQIAYMSVMLSVLFETRFLLGIGRSGRYTVFSFVAFFFCTVSSVPALIAFFSRDFSGFLGAADYAVSQVGLLAVAVYCACRFIDAIRGAQDYTAQELEALRQAEKAEDEKK